MLKRVKITLVIAITSIPLVCTGASLKLCANTYGRIFETTKGHAHEQPSADIHKAIAIGNVYSASQFDAFGQVTRAQALPHDVKVKFFDVEVAYAETILAFFEEAEECMRTTSSDFINKIIIKHFVSDSDDHGYRRNVMPIFQRDNSDVYLFAASNFTEFDMITWLVGRGQAFAQAFDSVCIARDI